MLKQVGETKTLDMFANLVIARESLSLMQWDDLIISAPFQITLIGAEK
jgi:hypothetical protein